MTKYENKAIIYSCIKGVQEKWKTHFEKQKNLKALKANRYAEVKRNGGIVRVNRQSSQHQQSKRWEEENWKKLNKILL